MSYISEETAMEAARNLKEWCDSHYIPYETCDCPFANGTVCTLRDCLPKEFTVSCRWTEDDYNLARILKRNGASAIKKSGGVTTWIKGGLLNVLDSGMLPMGVFEALKNNDSIRLDDLTTEYEQYHK